MIFTQCELAWMVETSNRKMHRATERDWKYGSRVDAGVLRLVRSERLGL